MSGEAIFGVKPFLDEDFCPTLVGDDVYFWRCFLVYKAWGESDLPKILFHGKSTFPPPGHVDPPEIR